jgi:dienelactone hydrolase
MITTRKLPANVEIKSVGEVDEAKDIFDVPRQRTFKRTALSIEARPGDRVPCILAQPAGFDGKSKLPTIVFVHGSGQRKEFVEEICTPFNQAGFAMISYDQWNCGERKIKDSTLKKITAWYERGWKATNDARRIVDYLLTRDDVDPERIYLVGASYGAMTSTHILAHDKRFKAGVLVVGGGDFKIMLDAPLIRENVPAPILAVVQPIARWLGAAFDPIRSAGKTGPMPVLMQNGSADKLVSPEAGEALYAALSAPKEIKWYDVDHPGLRKSDGPEIVRMLDDGLAWLAVKAGVQLPVAAVAAAGEAQAAGSPAK